MKKRSALILVIAIILVFVSFIFDSTIVKGVSFLRNSLLDSFFLGITSIVSSIIIFFLITSLFLWKEHKRKWILPLWISLLLSSFVGFTLKLFIQRQRPFQQGIVETLIYLQKESYYIWDFSFPSGHAIFAFCAIPILIKEFPKLKYAWIVLASLIAFSRLYLGLHFLSDIIAGALIGYLIGAMIIQIEDKTKHFEKRYKKIRRVFRKK